MDDRKGQGSPGAAAALAGCVQCATDVDGRTRYEATAVRALFQLHHMMMRVGDRMTEPLGLTSSRWMMLCVIGREAEPRTIAEMSDDIRLSPQNISRMVASMEREGLVFRERAAGRGRAVRVGLTEAGWSAYRETHELAERFVAEFMRGFCAERASRFEGDLAALIENIDAFERRLLAEKAGRGERGGDGDVA